MSFFVSQARCVATARRAVPPVFSLSQLAVFTFIAEPLPLGSSPLGGQGVPRVPSCPLLSLLAPS